MKLPFTNGLMNKQAKPLYQFFAWPACGTARWQLPVAPVI
jgi:hypothetical protein